MTRQCDNASVGVMIGCEKDGTWLFFERATFPPGIAPCAGHVFDEHKSYEDAARAEVHEELGLHAEVLRPLPVGGWRPNRCRREPGPDGVGHEWRVYLASVSGELNPSPRETGSVHWLSAADIGRLMYRTLDYAEGGVTDAEWAARPGIEPVWVAFLAALGFGRVTSAELGEVELLATAGSTGH